MAGIIAGAMAGAGEGLTLAGKMLAEYLSRSQLQAEAAAIQEKRDDRLHGQRMREVEHADEVRRRPAREAMEAIERRRKELVDDPSGTMRTRTRSEMAEVEQEEFTRRGLVSEAMQARSLEQQRERDNQNYLDRRADNARADRQVDIAERTFNIHAKGADMDRQIKQIQLDNAKRVDELRKEFKTATPERKAQIEQELQILGAIKDNDKYLPVPLKDEFGAITGYRIFDTRRGDWADRDRGSTKEPTQADIDGLRAMANNPAAIAYFEQHFGKGSAARYLGGQKPADKPKSEPSASRGSSKPPSSSTKARDEREYRPDLEEKDPTLRAIRLALQSKDPTVSTNAWVRYVERVKELEAQR